MKKLIVLLAAAVSVAAGSTSTAGAAACSPRPTVTALTATGSTVTIGWSGVCGSLAKVKRDDSRIDPYHWRWYVESNTGSASIAGQPSGRHFYRVCDVSRATSVCSPVVAIAVGGRGLSVFKREPPSIGAYSTGPGSVLVHWVGVPGPTAILNECSYLTGSSLCTSTAIPNEQAIELDSLAAARYVFQVCSLPTGAGRVCTPYSGVVAVS